MFKFDFDIDDAEESLSTEPSISESTLPTVSPQPLQPLQEIPLSELLDTLPTLISYSPLTIPTTDHASQIVLPRRDLFDARFQLISGGKDNELDVEEGSAVPANGDETLAFLDAPSDLLPYIYEGGLKTWECSLDLVHYLHGLKDKQQWTASGKRLLEVGCGTAVPSLYLLHQLLESKVTSEKHTNVHLQDYNRSVLELVTLPNVILVWYMSTASFEYRAKTDSPSMDPTQPGEVYITAELKAAFVASLHAHRVAMNFFSGPWQSFNDRNYDVVLTSETIYRMDSLEPLIKLLNNACAKDMKEDVQTSTSEPLCLVAAKVIYFGVGGGVSAFIEAVEKLGGNVQLVWEKKTGVGRQIMQVLWGKSS